jgi:hypothetical protein
MSKGEGNVLHRPVSRSIEKAREENRGLITTYGKLPHMHMRIKKDFGNL